MLKNETNIILNIHNDEDGIVSVIEKSLIRYYSVNGFHHDQFEDNYLNYLRMLFTGHQFYFLDKEKLLSYKDQIFSTVMSIVRDDLLENVEPVELYQSCQWQPEAVEMVLAELFNNRLLLSIISH
ncbi:hypothetical protein [Serratia symbiotica]|uniref:Uncharacterized protein n=1 Tax=Serratia symbiotica TaxID=138074 RepID=A0A7D5SSN0_9GAMM|nr:hypothetical protein [Serratia symbiotica]QLH62878.1 hypothetical protein SYMBAF_07960 [Serratia symbiotica]